MFTIKYEIYHRKGSSYVDKHKKKKDLALYLYQIYDYIYVRQLTLDVW